MLLNLERFYQACNPSRPLMIENLDDRSYYYIDFASVRGGKIIEALLRTITRISPNTPTCQLFTGHLGCGKSTELLRLKAELEAQDFHVVYFESTHVLEMVDIDVTDVLLAIAGLVSKSMEAIKLRVQPTYFTKLFSEVVDFLQTPIELGVEAELSVGIGKITAKTKESPHLRRRLRDYLEPRTENILQSINTELLDRANLELKARGKKGLVVIVDNLDRVAIRPLPSGRSLPEYLFIDRGDQLRKLNCHIVYTIPLALTFSNDSAQLQYRLGGGLAPKILPRSALLVLYLLTDENHKRPFKTHAELKAELSELEDPSNLDLILSILVNSGLVVIFHNSPKQYQLIHDYLVHLIRHL